MCHRKLIEQGEHLESLEDYKPGDEFVYMPMYQPQKPEYQPDNWVEQMKGCWRCGQPPETCICDTL